MIDIPDPGGSGPAYKHPLVFVQNNVFNNSKINTVVICSLTSNITRAPSPGNVSLRKGEANLPKRSVVNVTQLLTVNKSDFYDKIGTLSKERVFEILNGIMFLLGPRDII